MNWGFFAGAARALVHIKVEDILRAKIRTRSAGQRYFVPLLATAVLLASCGDGGDDAESTASSNPPASNPPSNNPPPNNTPANSAPTISGTVPTEVAADYPYSFEPTASDSNGDALSFTVTNLPPWASFSQATGEISGNPTQANVGVYQNIRISVSDGTASASLAPFSIDVVAFGSGNALLSWVAPTENTDGSPLVNLDKYTIFWGAAPGSYAKSVEVDVGITSFLVEGLTRGTWYFSAKAINDAAVASTFSNIASKTIL
jgi:hypothetical protein